MARMWCERGGEVVRGGERARGGAWKGAAAPRERKTQCAKVWNEPEGERREKRGEEEGRGSVGRWV